MKALSFRIGNVISQIWKTCLVTRWTYYLTSQGRVDANTDRSL